MTTQAKKDFISQDLYPDKFDRKNGNSKLCGMSASVMSLRWVVVLLSALSLMPLQSAAQVDTTDASEFKLDSFTYIMKLPNGLNFLLAPRQRDTKVEITYHVKVGPVYENDTASGISHILQGILADKIASYLRMDSNRINFNNAAFRSYVTPELSVFQISTSPSLYPAALRLLKDSLNYATISEQEIRAKAEQVKKDYQETSKNFREVYSIKLRQYIYRDEAHRQLMYGDTSVYDKIEETNVMEYLSKYYGPNNSIVNAVGKFDLHTFQDTAKAIFGRVPRIEFDPESITKIFTFRSMIYTSRFLINTPEGVEPEVKISWMFPGARIGTTSSYCAHLFTFLLNDENNYIQAKARKMGCKLMRAEYDEYNFSSVFTVTLQPGKENFLQVYRFVLDEILLSDKNLINEGMMTAAKVGLTRWFDHAKLAPGYASQVTRFWVYNYEKYLPTLKDSVLKINEKQMRRFIQEYVVQSPHTTALIASEKDRTDMKLDSVFVPFTDSIVDLYFTYKKNATDLEGPDNAFKFTQLVEWLRENPDINVQINGKADRSEINNMKDKGLLAFVDSIPTFERSKGDFLIGSMMRTEMMRALKIARELYLNGIAANRIKGTSMSFRSKTDQQEEENRRATVTFEKHRVNYQLRDYYNEAIQQKELEREK